MASSGSQTGHSSAGKKGRVAVLDGLKGFSILSIMIYYYFQHQLPGGFFTVTIFLTLAGYMSFRSRQKVFAGKQPSKNLWGTLGRLFFPLLWMILVTVAYLVLTAPDRLTNIRFMALSSLAFVNNWYQILAKQSYFVQSANPSPFVHLWYVSLYFQMILLGEGLKRVFSRFHLLRMQEYITLLFLGILSSIALVAIYVIDQDPSRAYYSLIARIAPFLFGASLSYLTQGKLLIHKHNRQQLLIASGLGFLALAALMWMMRHLNGTMSFVYQVGFFLASLLSLLILFMALQQDSLLNYFFRFKGFTFLGKRSYSYYLWFYPIHFVLPKQLMFLENQNLSIGVQVVLICLMAELSYRVFEQKDLPLLIGQSLKPGSGLLAWNRQMPLWVKGLNLTLSLIYVGALGLACLGMVQASGSQQATVDQVQSVIEANQARLAQQAQQTVETTSSAQEESSEETSQASYSQALDQVGQYPYTFIGDSTSLAAAGAIQAEFPQAIIDGEVGRQFYMAPGVISDVYARGQLAQRVVVALGTNGDFTAAQADEVIQTIGPGHTIYLVGVLGNQVWSKSVNNELKAAAKRHEGVYFLDWGPIGDQHLQDWYLDDQIHPNEIGSGEFAKFIKESIAKIEVGQAS